jgi:hypothetical protein
MFLETLQTRYPHHFSGIPGDRIDIAYEKILLGQLSWISPQTDTNTSLQSALIGDKNDTAFMVKAASYEQTKYINDSGFASKTIYSNSNIAFMQSNNISETSDVNSSMQQDHEDSVLRLVGYIFHKTSLSISVILVLYVSI